MTQRPVQFLCFSPLHVSDDNLCETHQYFCESISAFSQPLAVCIQKHIYHLMPDQYIFIETFTSIALLEVFSS